MNRPFVFWPKLVHELYSCKLGCCTFVRQTAVTLMRKMAVTFMRNIKVSSARQMVVS